MGNKYDIRQSSFSDGDVIDAIDFNAEFDQILSVFKKTDGHSHNGENGEGDYVPLISTSDGSTQVAIDTTNPSAHKIVFKIDGQITSEQILADGAETFTTALLNKLNGIEEAATADQTAEEIEALYEGIIGNEKFSSILLTKLNGIEEGATADQTAAEIKSLYESNADTNVFTDAEKTKLGTVESNAKDDQIASEVPVVDNMMSTSGTNVQTVLEELDAIITANPDFSDKLLKTANLSDVSDVVAARNNLGVREVVEAIRQANRDRYGASGFVEWGKMYPKGGSVGNINIGMFTDSSKSDLIILGDNHPSVIGTSKTNHAVITIDGSELHIKTIKTANSPVNWVTDYPARAAIKLPPAPDGLTTVDGGTITEHPDVTSAFAGLINNGLFNDAGTTGWVPNAAASLSNVNSTLRITKDSSGSAASTTYTVPSGFKLNVEYSIKINAKGYSDATSSYRLQAVGAGVNIIQTISKTKGEYVLKVTPTSAGNLTIALYNDSATVGQYLEINSVAMRTSATENIINRQDLVGVEVFDELITEKNWVVPLGNVQYGASTWNGITLVNNVIAQGYSAQHEGDTVTLGYGAVWSTLSDADKDKFLVDPKNNISVTEDGQLVQRRFRIRSIAGLEGDWSNIKTNGTLEVSNSSTRVLPQGALTTKSDLGDRIAGGRGYYPSTEANAIPLKGAWKAWNTGNTEGAESSIAYNGFCVFIPIVLVNRRNQGAYEPTYNPNGVSWVITNNGANGGEWHRYPNVLTDVSKCFDYYVPVTNTTGTASSPTQGAIGGSQVGRPDGRFYDAIYAADITDLRLDVSQRHNHITATETIFTRAKNGSARGRESVKFTKVLGQVTVSSTNTQKITTPAMSLGYQGVVAVYNRTKGTYFSAFCFGNGGTDIWPFGIENAPYKKGVLDIAYNGDITSPAVYNTFGGDVLDIIQWSELPIYQNGDDYTQTDIIGDPANILATFPNGVVGEWIPFIPDGVADRPALNKKALTLNNTLISTADSGSTWSSSASSADGTDNRINFSNIPSGLVGLYTYKAHANFTESANNEKVLHGYLSDVWASNSAFTNRGCLLSQSTISKILTNVSVAPTVVEGFGFEGFELQDGTLNTGNAYKPTHNTLTLASDDYASLKTFAYPVNNNGLVEVNYVYKEMVFDSGAQGATAITDSTSFLAEQGKSYHIKDSSSNWYGLIVTRVGADQTVNLRDTAYGLGANDVLMYNSVAATTWTMYDGNGFGDNNKFTIVNGESTEVDYNGNTIKVGTHKSTDDLNIFIKQTGE